MNRKEFKKSCRNSVNLLLAYSFVTYAIVMVSLIVHVIWEYIKGTNIDRLMEDDAYWERIEAGGIEYLLIVFIGVLMIAIFRKSAGSWKTMFQSKKVMNKVSFVKLFFVFMMPQFLGLILDFCGEGILNYFGYTMEMSVESAFATSESIGMLLYAGIIGPVAEELWFRGVILKNALPYGKRFAIIASSVLFGVFHANIPQAIFATMVGLILAYVAVEYSIFWSIALHIFNNLIMGDGVGFLISGLEVKTQDLICNLLMLVFFVVGILILLHDKKEIKEYFKENPKGQGKHYLWYFTMAGTLIFIITNFVVSLLGISKL